MTERKREDDMMVFLQASTERNNVRTSEMKQELGFFPAFFSLFMWQEKLKFRRIKNFPRKN
jgi:hypothetical protein